MAEIPAGNTIDIALQHHQAGRLREAERIYRQILATQPDNPDALHLLGLVAYQLGRIPDAVQLIRRTIALRPAAPEPYNNLAAALQENGDLDEAFAACRQAINLKLNYPEAFGNLANLFKAMGQIDHAIAAYRQALVLQPVFPEAEGSLICCYHFLPGHDPGAIAAEHKNWGKKYADPLKQFIQPHASDRNPDRRLRIGYVSADFRDHPVGRFLLPLLSSHDHETFEVYCYSTGFHADPMTAQLRSAADHWRDIVALSDEQAANQVRADGIDILVDLSGHTAGGRLLLFARKPAPVQVSYLGYPNTAGLSTIDYRFTDALADPPGPGDADFLEKLYRLPRTNWCYAEPTESSPIKTLPPPVPGHVTFGSFNNFAKVNEPMLQTWTTILREVPQSRLLLKAAALGVQSVCQRVREIFKMRGIDPDRLTLHRSTPDYSSHLALYDEMDIALDTFPYHGTTTTCEALWHGVPVVTLAGHSHVSRVGVSLLTNAGLPELIAGTMEEYASRAIGLAQDRQRLSELRGGLRERMRQSPLMDGKGFARDVETAYRKMWQELCART